MQLIVTLRLDRLTSKTSHLNNIQLRNLLPIVREASLEENRRYPKPFDLCDRLLLVKWWEKTLDRSFIAK